jgi:hypothetical protein
MRDDDPLAVGLLVLGGVALAGMLFGAWQLVLYPSLVLMGVLLAMALAGRPTALQVGLPAGVTAMLVVLYGILHAMGIASPSGTGSFLGWDPMTALYLFGVGPAFVLVGLLYALTDREVTR